MDNCCKKINNNNNCCMNAKLKVETNIISIIEAFVDHPSITINYEIVITNNSQRKIMNLKVLDSLWGIGLTETNELNFTLTAISGCKNIVINNNDIIISSCGEIVDSTLSYLDCCSSCTILLTMSLGPNIYLKNTYLDVGPIIIPHLCNTVIVSGTLTPSDHCNVCKIEKQIIPIVSKSPPYNDDTIYIFQQVDLPGNACNVRLCFPYTNTRCSKITCPRIRPK